MITTTTLGIAMVGMVIYHFIGNQLQAGRDQRNLARFCELEAELKSLKG